MENGSSCLWLLKDYETYLLTAYCPNISFYKVCIYLFLCTAFNCHSPVVYRRTARRLPMSFYFRIVNLQVKFRAHETHMKFTSLHTSRVQLAPWFEGVVTRFPIRRLFALDLVLVPVFFFIRGSARENL